MTHLCEEGNETVMDIFVKKELHRLSEAGKMDLALYQHAGRIVGSDFNVFGRQGRIGLQNFLNRSALLQHLQNQINHDSSPLEAWFTMTDFRIHRDIFLNKVHAFNDSNLTPEFHRP